MKHLHLKLCASTQSLAKNYFNQFSEVDFLISSEAQSNGRGRRGKTWISESGNLHCSFKTRLYSIPQASALYYSLAVVHYFKTQDINLYLKWPNDIVDHKGRKIGGLLIESIGHHHCLIGLGLNLVKSPKLDTQNLMSFGSASLKQFKNHSFDTKKLSFDLFHYLNNFKGDLGLWNQSCLHLSKEVEIYDENKLIMKGRFLGIGNSGQAIIEDYQKGLKKEVYNGSLRMV